MNDDLRDRLQNQIVDLISEKLQTGQITEPRAREMAAMVLEKMPEGISSENLIRIVPTLDDEFAELKEVVLPIMLEYEDKLRNAIDRKVQNLIRLKKFKEALKLTKQGIEYTSKFVNGEG